MRKEIQLQMADGTTKTLAFLTNAATPIRYRNLYGHELMGDIAGIMGALTPDVLQKIGKAEGEAETTVDFDSLDPETLQAYISVASSGSLWAVQQMAFVMNCQAEGVNMRQIGLDDYLDWLEQFETLEFLSHAIDFIYMYMAGKESGSELKKNQDQLTGK